MCVFKIVKIISLPLPEYPEKEKKKSGYEKQDIIDRLEEILDDLSDEEIEALKLAQFQRAGMRRAAVQDMGNNRFTLEVYNLQNALFVAYKGRCFWELLVL